MVAPELPARCVGYTLSISFQAAFSGSHIWINRRLLRCPITAINKREYVVRGVCKVDNNGGVTGNFATVVTTLTLVSHRTHWRFAILIFLDVDTHGRVIRIWVVPPSCPDRACTP